MDIDHLLELLNSLFQRRKMGVPNARIVDERVDLAERRDDLSNHSDNVGFGRHIAPDREVVSPQLLRSVVSLNFVDICNCDAVPCPSKRLRHRPADAVPGTGDQGHFRPHVGPPEHSMPVGSERKVRRSLLG